jgi:hypothetical protein
MISFFTIIDFRLTMDQNAYARLNVDSILKVMQSPVGLCVPKQ